MTATVFHNRRPAQSRAWLLNCAGCRCVDHFPIDRSRAEFGLWLQFKPGAIRIAICSFRLLSASI